MSQYKVSTTTWCRHNHSCWLDRFCIMHTNLHADFAKVNKLERQDRNWFGLVHNQELFTRPRSSKFDFVNCVGVTKTMLRKTMAQTFSVICRTWYPPPPHAHPPTHTPTYTSTHTSTHTPHRGVWCWSTHPARQNPARWCGVGGGSEERPQQIVGRGRWSKGGSGELSGGGISSSQW